MVQPARFQMDYLGNHYDPYDREFQHKPGIVKIPCILWILMRNSSSYSFLRNWNMLDKTSCVCEPAYGFRCMYAGG